MKTLQTVYVLIIFLLPLIAKAQYFSGGLELGISASQIDGDSWDGYKKPGPVIGAYVETSLGNRLSFGLSTRIIGKGSQASYKQYSQKISLFYVEVPLYINYNLKNRFGLEIGASGAYLIKQRALVNNEVISEDDKNYKNSDFNIIAGIAYKLRPKLQLKMRIQYSILSIYKNTDFFNRLLSFSIFYKLGKNNEDETN